MHLEIQPIAHVQWANSRVVVSYGWVELEAPLAAAAHSALFRDAISHRTSGRAPLGRRYPRLARQPHRLAL
jgi:hypothetical protein